MGGGSGGDQRRQALHEAIARAASSHRMASWEQAPCIFISLVFVPEWLRACRILSCLFSGSWPPLGWAAATRAMNDDELKARFRAFRDPGDDPGMLAAALLVAACDRPEFEAAWVEAELAAMTAAAEGYVAGHAHPRAQVEGLCFYLKDVVGLHGDPERYYERNNSYIDCVLESRCGIPITLGVIYAEVGQRLGLNCEGVNFPGHFLIRARVNEVAATQLLIDPFAGQVISHADCQAFLQQMQGEAQTLGPQHLQSASSQEVLVRMLNNLKQLAFAQGDYLGLIRHSQWIQEADPRLLLEHRDRALAYEQIQDWASAIIEWEMLAGSMTDGEPRRTLLARVAELERKSSSGRIVH